MIIRDSIGQVVNEGDIVLIPIGNSMAQGTIKKIDNGLGSNLVAQSDGKVLPAMPSVMVEIHLIRSVIQSGQMLDTIKITPNKESVQ